MKGKKMNSIDFNGFFWLFAFVGGFETIGMLA